MVDDPIFIVIDIAAVVVLAWSLFGSLAPTHHFVGQWRWRSALLGALGLSLAAIYCVLTTWASFDVVDSTFYVLGYLSLGVIWISVSSRVLSSFADIRLQQDVRDRNNLAAAVAIGGLQLGSAVAYAGGNIGDGPGFQVVIFSALLSTLTVYGSAWVMALVSDGEERISIDHDLGAAIRLAGVAIATGIVAGRGAAGDWVSAEATLVDFVVVTWPVVLIVMAGVIMERRSPPSYASINLLESSLFAAVALAVAGAYVYSLGAW
jgi:uncharacterized membrane protein YjfL (UPF0719 family)